MFGFKLPPKEHRPPLQWHEWVLAWAMISPDEAVVATNLGLWHGGRRMPWNEISKAVWDGTVLTVTPSSVVERREGYDVIADLPPIRFALADPGHLPHQVRLRVTGSVERAQRFAHGMVAARRVPGVDGLSWVVRYDAGADPAEHAAETDALMKETH